MRMLPVLVAVLVALFLRQALCLAGEQGRIKTRLLFSFENPGEVEQLLADSSNTDIIVVQDNCVTEGMNCARFTFKKGVDWGHFTLGKDVIKGWSDFDYFAMDVYTEERDPQTIVFELWDQASTNYHSRCTFEGTATHPGRQTLLWQINRAKRNSKEGREWHELEPRDKIDLDNLKMVKIFTTPPKDRDLVLWIDNLRLMQEDAAKPKMKVWLPERTIAFDFGSPGAVLPGFKPAGAKAGADYGFTATEALREAGLGWPDPLAGKFVWSPSSAPITFKAQVPDGDYLVWLCAGKVIRHDLADTRFLLKLNDLVFCDEKPAWEEFASEKYLYRFLGTQYSERENAVWLNYIDKMYQVRTGRLKVTGGAVTLDAVNHFLSGLILVPVEKAADYDRMVAELKAKRIEAFYKSFYAAPQAKPSRAPEDPEFIFYIPDAWAAIHPGTGPTPKEKSRRTIKQAGAPGQWSVMRIAVVPFEDLGKCTLAVSDLTGPGVIPASNIRGHYQSYRGNGAKVSIDVLIPSLTLEMEKAVTQCYWLWLKVPPNAAPGIYRGTFRFTTATGKTADIPVEYEVYPFKLEDPLPVSYGMYYGGRNYPPFKDDIRRAKLKEQLEWMREIGFTAVCVGCPRIAGIDLERKTARLSYDTTFYELAREVGMGRSPEQLLMASQLGMARSIARQLPAIRGAKVDQQPGIELKQPEFAPIYKDALRQYRQFLDSMKLPVMVEVVDEPREVPNPWNRNLADTIAYAVMMKEAGIRSFVTPMSDRNGGLDYTVLADHVDILSVHAWPASKGLIERARKNGKTLHFYNTGKDRFSWGFYPWKMGCVGRWEWHFSWEGDGNAVGGYPCDEWYNPFVARNGLAANAPDYKFRGGILYRGDYLDICEGINDYAYIYTLEKAIARNASVRAKAAVAREAKDFLAALKRAIPDFPRVKGMASEADGALVGMGIEDDAAHKADEWRSKIADYLKKLNW